MEGGRPCWYATPKATWHLTFNGTWGTSILPSQSGYYANYSCIYGAYTEIYSGLAPNLTIQKDQGGYVIPWGRTGFVRPDLVNEAKKESGQASKLFEWCEKEAREYA